MLHLACLFVAPQRVNVYNCKCAILLIGHLDSDCPPLVVHEPILRNLKINFELDTLPGSEFNAWGLKIQPQRLR